MIVDFTDKILEAKEKKTLNKPFRTPGGPKKFSVYVKNEKGNVVKVNFGDPNMEIKRDDPARRKSFRARHNCDNPGPKTKARYWSCQQWRAGKRVQGSEIDYEWDGQTFFDHDELLTINPALAFIEEEVTDEGDCGCGNCDCDEVEAKHKPLHDMKKYSFNNPGQAMQMARKMGFDKVHTHGEGDDTVFMPGPSHEALMKKIGESKAEEEYASLWENIKKKRDRIKRGSGEKMRKKGDKGAPTPEQIEKAKKASKASEEYVMSLEEFEEIMDLEEIEFWKEESDAAKRPGRKSGAQTPAKPSERRKGSSKNKPGSAGKGGPSITFSEKVTKSLKEKVKNHNAKSKKKVTLGQLKKVYRRGAGAFSSSHRPGMSRGGWAMARVNMFLKMKRGGKVKDSYRKADGDI
tara:strand:- start:2825 stop:4039 length:1215 start_codon:yes stop_codon:yes gene_type:complete